MENTASTETNVVSSVLRFVYDKPHEWHGVIRHVQSDAEIHFKSWGDVTKLVAEYVEVGETPLVEIEPPKAQS